MDYAEVSKHSTKTSCWVILYDNVYDVTDFLPSHPGGASIILKLAGKDATEEYDPVHPPGTLEENLEPEARLGKIDPATLPKEEKTPTAAQETDGPPPLDQLLNINDIEAAATKLLTPKAWAYYYSAGDDLLSKSLNNAVYQQIYLRPRVFIDCTKCDTSTNMVGHKLSVPFFVSPAAMARLAHPSGEHGIAQACSTFGAAQMISNNASLTPEQIVEGSSPDQVFGWQLYVQNEREKSEKMLQRIAKLPQIKFVVLTLDAPVPGKREHDERSKNVSANLPVRSSVEEGKEAKKQGDPQAGGRSDAEGEEGSLGKFLFAGTAADLTWKTTLPWLARHTDLPIILKGVQTHEDAYMAMLYRPQVRGIILSNHGGRALDTAPPAIHTLLEIRKYCPEVLSRIEVYVDGGIKRGTDIVKALCLGAKAVGLGRAPLYALACGGRAGVERLFDILRTEIETCMRLLGVERVDQLGLQHINSRALERDIFDGPAGLEKMGMWVQAKL